MASCKRIVIVSMTCCAISSANAMYRDEMKNVSPEVRELFEHMKAPNGAFCCSYADGHRTEYDVRQGRYWVPIDGEWYPVPRDTLVTGANPVGQAIVWYLPQVVDGIAPGPMPEGKWKIICFLPADGV